MVCKYVVLLLILGNLGWGEDDKKWKWADNNRENSEGRRSRYEVFEDEAPLGSYQNYHEYQHPNGFIPNERPGGIYNNFNRPIDGNYGHGHLDNYRPNLDNTQPPVLTGPVPSWVKEGPFKNYDKCRCTEKFNCPAPGVSYGHCDVGKQYCCFITNRHHQAGGPNPSRPIHSIDNGVLVGPDGPYDLPPGRRPGGGYYRPRPGGGYHGGSRPILAGPGGPYDRPNFGISGGNGGGYGAAYGRSTKSA